MNQKSRVLVKQLLNDPTVAKSFLPLQDNVDNLDANIVAELYKLRGTKLGRQEVGGELVEDTEGAYFFQSQIDDDRIYPEHARPKKNLPRWFGKVTGGVELIRVVVAIDPAATNTEDSDETGMIVAALGDNGHGYVLEDLSGHYSPDEWAHKAVDAYNRWHADKIVAEVNNGGDMVAATIHTVDADANVGEVRATRGKILRAEPVSAAYNQHRVHHLGSPEDYEALEAQLVDCLPGQEQAHDDRLDACVYALTEIGLAGAGMSWEDVYKDEKDKVEEASSARMATGAPESSQAAIGSADWDAEDEEEYDPWAATYR